jgi:hypothetical protein
VPSRLDGAVGAVCFAEQQDPAEILSQRGQTGVREGLKVERPRVDLVIEVTIGQAGSVEARPASAGDSSLRPSWTRSCLAEGATFLEEVLSCLARDPGVRKGTFRAQAVVAPNALSGQAGQECILRLRVWGMAVICPLGEEGGHSSRAEHVGPDRHLGRRPD